ncbi:MAG TPA: sulfite exporter TauE/SafE family protein [bacterium]|nr:sulfite exporter TauE/SafE family protein [bacterium]
MEQENRIRTELIKSAAVVFVLLIILTGLFIGQQQGQRGVARLEAIIFGDITYMEALNLLLLGFLSGAVGGMLGMGGGVLKVVNLHLFLGFDILFARIVSLISYSVISISAFVRYRKYGFILWDVVKILIPSSILGVLLGVIIGNWLYKDYVEILLGIYALIAGIIVLNQIWIKADEKEIFQLFKNKISETTASGIGIAMGIICSIIGISGGIISTPLQHTLLKLPLKNAIANTIAAAVFCSITASVILLFYGLKNRDFLLADVVLVSICLIPGNILGGQLGSYLTKVMHINHVRAAFAIVAFAIGFKILLQY